MTSNIQQRDLNELIQGVPDDYTIYLRNAWALAENREKAANHAKWCHYTLGVVVILGGIILSIFTSRDSPSGAIHDFFYWGLVGLGSVVSLCGSLNTFFSFERRMQQNLKAARGLKSACYTYRLEIRFAQSSQQLADLTRVFLKSMETFGGMDVDVTDIAALSRDGSSSPGGIHNVPGTAKQ